MESVSKKYSYSFTVGGLLLNEFNLLGEFLVNNNINDLKKKVVGENLFKINSESSRERFFSEIKKRVNNVDKALWEHFVECNLDEKKALLFFVMLKSFPLLFDLQYEMILEKYRLRDLDFSKDTLQNFFVKKSFQKPELAEWSDAVKKKVSSSIMLILSQSGIINQNKITPFIFGGYFWNQFINYGDVWFLELALLNKHDRDSIIEGNYGLELSL